MIECSVQALEVCADIAAIELVGQAGRHRVEPRVRPGVVTGQHGKVSLHAAAPESDALGSCTRMTLPEPSLLATSMLPPSDVTMSWQMVSPSPVPMPGAFVV